MRQRKKMKSSLVPPVDPSLFSKPIEGIVKKEKDDLSKKQGMVIEDQKTDGKLSKEFKSLDLSSSKKERSKEKSSKKSKKEKKKKRLREEKEASHKPEKAKKRKIAKDTQAVIQADQIQGSEKLDLIAGKKKQNDGHAPKPPKPPTLPQISEAEQTAVSNRTEALAAPLIKTLPSEVKAELPPTVADTESSLQADDVDYDDDSMSFEKATLSQPLVNQKPKISLPSSNSEVEPYPIIEPLSLPQPQLPSANEPSNSNSKSKDKMDLEDPSLEDKKPKLRSEREWDDFFSGMETFVDTGELDSDSDDDADKHPKIVIENKEFEEKDVEQQIMDSEPVKIGFMASETRKPVGERLDLPATQPLTNIFELPKLGPLEQYLTQKTLTDLEDPNASSSGLRSPSSSSSSSPTAEEEEKKSDEKAPLTTDTQAKSGGGKVNFVPLSQPLAQPIDIELDREPSPKSPYTKSLTFVKLSADFRKGHRPPSPPLVPPVAKDKRAAIIKTSSDAQPKEAEPTLPKIKKRRRNELAKLLEAIPQSTKLNKESKMDADDPVISDKDSKKENAKNPEEPQEKELTKSALVEPPNKKQKTASEKEDLKESESESVEDETMDSDHEREDDGSDENLEITSPTNEISDNLRNLDSELIEYVKKYQPGQNLKAHYLPQGTVVQNIHFSYGEALRKGTEKNLQSLRFFYGNNKNIHTNLQQRILPAFNTKYQTNFVACRIGCYTFVFPEGEKYKLGSCEGRNELKQATAQFFEYYHTFGIRDGIRILRKDEEKECLSAIRDNFRIKRSKNYIRRTNPSNTESVFTAEQISTPEKKDSPSKNYKTRYQQKLKYMSAPSHSTGSARPPEDILITKEAASASSASRDTFISMSEEMDSDSSSKSKSKDSLLNLNKEQRKAIKIKDAQESESEYEPEEDEASDSDREEDEDRPGEEKDGALSKPTDKIPDKLKNIDPKLINLMKKYQHGREVKVPYTPQGQKVRIAVSYPAKLRQGSVENLQSLYFFCDSHVNVYGRLKNDTLAGINTKYNTKLVAIKKGSFTFVFPQGEKYKLGSCKGREEIKKATDAFFQIYVAKAKKEKRKIELSTLEQENECLKAIKSIFREPSSIERTKFELRSKKKSLPKSVPASSPESASSVSRETLISMSEDEDPTTTQALQPSLTISSAAANEQISRSEDKKTEPAPSSGSGSASSAQSWAIVDDGFDKDSLAGQPKTVVSESNSGLKFKLRKHNAGPVSLSLPELPLQIPESLRNLGQSDGMNVDDDHGDHDDHSNDDEHSQPPSPSDTDSEETQEGPQIQLPLPEPGLSTEAPLPMPVQQQRPFPPLYPVPSFVPPLPHMSGPIYPFAVATLPPVLLNRNRDEGHVPIQSPGSIERQKRPADHHEEPRALVPTPSLSVVDNITLVHSLNLRQASAKFLQSLYVFSGENQEGIRLSINQITIPVFNRKYGTNFTAITAGNYTFIAPSEKTVLLGADQGRSQIKRDTDRLFELYKEELDGYVPPLGEVEEQKCLLTLTQNFPQSLIDLPPAHSHTSFDPSFLHNPSPSDLMGQHTPQRRSPSADSESSVEIQISPLSDATQPSPMSISAHTPHSHSPSTGSGSLEAAKMTQVLDAPQLRSNSYWNGKATLFQSVPLSPSHPSSSALGLHPIDSESDVGLTLEQSRHDGYTLLPGSHPLPSIPMDPNQPDQEGESFSYY